MAPPPMTTPLWDPDLMAQAETLEWRSRVLVEGFLQGYHQSRLRGFSSEFAQYHAYIPGEDLRHLDWRAYARLDRLYVREFQAETNLRGHVMIDASASMGFSSGATGFRKMTYASLVGISLVRLLQSQADACGVSLACQRIEDYVPPRLGSLHFLRCLKIFENAQPQGESDLAACIHGLGEIFPRRGLVVIFSDFWCDLAPLREALGRLRYDRHEICLFQILDPREIDFDFKEGRVFQDMETGLRIPVSPLGLKPQYLQRVGEHQKQLESMALDLGVAFRRFSLEEPPFQALATFLAARERFV